MLECKYISKFSRAGLDVYRSDMLYLWVRIRVRVRIRFRVRGKVRVRGVRVAVIGGVRMRITLNFLI